MIPGFFNVLETYNEFFIAFGVVIGFVMIFSSAVLKSVQKTNRKRIVTLFIISLCLSIILSIIAFFGYFLFTKYSHENLNLYLLFTLILAINLNLSLVVNTRREISRAKKSMSFSESVEKSLKVNSKKVLDIMIYYFLFLLAVLFLANRETGSFIGILFISVLVCSCVLAFVPSFICKLSEKIFK